MRGWRIALVASALVLGVAGTARADGAASDDVDALFKEGLSALDAQRPGDAIADFEAMGDRGVVDAVVSFDRGLAYAQRIRAGGAVPGDFGRAALGFEEARALTRDAELATRSDQRPGNDSCGSRPEEGACR